MVFREVLLHKLHFYFRDILRDQTPGATQCQGWVKHLRKQKENTFIDLRQAHFTIWLLLSTVRRLKP
jgi:hypothetical protein